MNNKIVSRHIKSVKDIEYVNRSQNHTAGLIVEFNQWKEQDPFLLMAEDFFPKGAFGLHPHRGIETVTYVVNGNLNHFDNKNGAGVLATGDVQWMTAGSGVLHSEEPPGDEIVHTLQLWVNLPSERKMTTPRYQNLLSKDAPVTQEEGVTVRVFSGSSKEVKSSTLNHVPVTMVEIIMEPGTTMIQDLPGSYNGFLYILGGKGTFGESEVKGKKNQVLWLERANEARQSEVRIHAEEKLHVMLYAGEPIGELVVARGPFVMNTEEEIDQAHQDFRNRNFE